MPQTPFISVIVTTYNRPDALAAVVEACFAQNQDEFEIIIADDGSAPATSDCISTLKRRAPVALHHVWQPHDGFRAAMSRNRGIRAARGDYIVFLDGDCVPQRDFVAQHRKLARRGYLVTGSRVLLSAPLTARVLAERIDLAGASTADKIAYRLRGDTNKLLPLVLKLPDLGRERRSFTYRRIKSCNLGVWRRDLDAVNGFDEGFRGWGFEDADLVVRLYNAGIHRKYGAFATEVLHLWHPAALRDRAGGNQRLVLERAANKTVRVRQGLDNGGALQ
jgi:glycosyltransferase involved in cell wall biosynthesis